MNEWMNAFVSRQVVWLAALSEGCAWEADRWLGVPHKSTARRASLWEGFISGHSWGFSHTISGGRSEGASVSTWLPSQLLASLEAVPGKVFIDRGRWPRYFFSWEAAGRGDVLSIRSSCPRQFFNEIPQSGLTLASQATALFVVISPPICLFFVVILAILQGNGPLFCFVFLTLWEFQSLKNDLFSSCQWQTLGARGTGKCMYVSLILNWGSPVGLPLGMVVIFQKLFLRNSDL